MDREDWPQWVEDRWQAYVAAHPDGVELDDLIAAYAEQRQLAAGAPAGLH